MGEDGTLRPAYSPGLKKSNPIAKWSILIKTGNERKNAKDSVLARK